MRILGKEGSILMLLIKAIKVIGIKWGFVMPTWKAKFILRIFECSYGSNLRVCGKVYFRLSNKAAIQLGDNVTLTARFLTNSVGITNPVMIECIGNGRIIIGDNSGLTSAVLSSRSLIKIGENVKIGGNVRIFDHDFHSLNYLNRRSGKKDFVSVKTSEIIIEDDVFIGTNAIILKGVHIGARSIIAAGSVVTIKSIPVDSIIAGNPAEIIGNVASGLHHVS